MFDSLNLNADHTSLANGPSGDSSLEQREAFKPPKYFVDINTAEGRPAMNTAIPIQVVFLTIPKYVVTYLWSRRKKGGRQHPSNLWYHYSAKYHPTRYFVSRCQNGVSAAPSMRCREIRSSCGRSIPSLLKLEISGCFVPSVGIFETYFVWTGHFAVIA